MYRGIEILSTNEFDYKMKNIVILIMSKGDFYFGIFLICRLSNF